MLEPAALVHEVALGMETTLNGQQEGRSLGGCHVPADFAVHARFNSQLILCEKK